MVHNISLYFMLFTIIVLSAVLFITWGNFTSEIQWRNVICVIRKNKVYYSYNRLHFPITWGNFTSEIQCQNVICVIRKISKWQWASVNAGKFRAKEMAGHPSMQFINFTTIK